MASHYFSSNSHLDRKSLKRPDGFLAALSRFFNGLAKNLNLMTGLLIGLLGLGLLTAFFMNRMDTKSEAAQNALFLAEKTLETELKALAPPEQKPKTPPKLISKDQPATPTDSTALLAYKKMDVDAQLPHATKELKAVEQNFSRTRAAFEARLKLGDLYFNHGEFSKALPWYDKALDSAPGNLEKVLTLSSLGYVKENLGQPAEAIQIYQKAINLGEGSLKGDLLMGIARGYEAVHDLAKARSTYDQILFDLPSTEYAKSAELFKSQIQ